METQVRREEDAMLLGQSHMMKLMGGCVEIMAIKCAVELGIADILNSYAHPIPLSTIASHIKTPNTVLDPNGLARIMRLLVRKRLFDTISDPSGTLIYSLNNTSKWLLSDSELSLAPLLLMVLHPYMVSPFHFLSQSLVQGGSAFSKANGREAYDFASINPEFNELFNKAMTSASKITTKAMLSKYDGFSGVGSLVDVGGGAGATMVEILKAHPHIKAINFDLSHVIATAPPYTGLTHVGGDMFTAIPNADGLLFKMILHNWNDEDCVKILKKCKEAIPKKTGKVIIVDSVLQEGGDGLFDDTNLVTDITMLAIFPGGKERTELDWKKVLEQGGFPRYNIIKIPAPESIIEAFP